LIAPETEMPPLDVVIPEIANAAMDRDHREEVRRLEEVAAAAARGEAETTLAAWRELVRFTREHFSREEAELGRHHYAALKVHAAEHRLLLTAMKEEEAALAETGDLARFRRYVEDAMPAWLSQHIGTTDAIAARFLAEHGAA
jgi:hemerythrin